MKIPISFNFLFRSLLVILFLILIAIIVIQRTNYFDLRGKFHALSTQTSKNYKQLLWKTLSPITFKEYGLNNYDNIFSKSQLPITEVNSWKGLHSHIQSRFIKYKNELSKQWGFSGELLEAAFLLNASHNLWARGNKQDDSGNTKPFGIRNIKVLYNKKHINNPELQLKDPDKTFISDYLKSDKGDCNDFAMMLYMLLNLSNISARHVGTSDHIYVEAKINKQTYILDSFHNFFVRGTIEEYLEPGEIKNMTFHMFKSFGTNPMNANGFRKRTGNRRIFQIISNRLVYELGVNIFICFNIGTRFFIGPIWERFCWN